MGFAPRLVGERVVLRPPVAADREVRRAFGRHEEIQRMYGVATPTTGPWTDVDAEGWFHRLGAGATIEWVIDAEERLLGATRLSFDGPSSAKFAIGFFDPARLGQGFGTEVTRMVVRYAFEELELARVHLDVLEFNERAIRCYANAGFRAIRRKPSDVVVNGTVVDDIVMSMSAAEYHVTRAQPPS